MTVSSAPNVSGNREPNRAHPRHITLPISSELQAVLQHIVDDVVNLLGCVGAMVATLEPDDSLPVRAYAVSMPRGLLNTLENQLGVSFIGPRSVAYLHDDDYQQNLSIRAVKGQAGHPQTVRSDRLYDLFRPVVNKPLSDLAQRAAGIKQVIAVPFSLDDEVVGNLFAATRTEFSDRDVDFLTAFGKQAAIAIQSQSRLAEIQVLERVILALQASMTDETQILQMIVDAVVQKLHYAAAMVAPVEEDGSLPIRAYATDDSEGLVARLQKRLGISILGPEAVVYLDDETYAQNLGVRSVKQGGQPNILISDDLYDLLCPIVDRESAEFVQRLSHIKQVIAVPFSIDGAVLGSLFVTSRRPIFSEREKEVLIILAQQAAVGIRNARIYHKAEERRQIAQMFGKLAFSATAYIHALRNHIGVSLTYLQLLDVSANMPDDQRLSLLNNSGEIIGHLDKAVNILDNLHEPWRQSTTDEVSVNDCLNTAIGKIFPEARLNSYEGDITTDAGLTIRKQLADNLAQLEASPDMLIEAFRVLIKNAVQAVEEREGATGIWIRSRRAENHKIAVSIHDDGVGIKPENLHNIFDMGWSTRKGKGMGFGLFWTKDYIEGLGGSIQVDSVWQEGTTFRIKLPSVETVQTEDADDG